jgi:hypothetical protein
MGDVLGHHILIGRTSHDSATLARRGSAPSKAAMKQPPPAPTARSTRVWEWACMTRPRKGEGERQGRDAGRRKL